MMLVMMAGCWVRNWFSPVPLCRIPGGQGIGVVTAAFQGGYFYWLMDGEGQW